MVWPLMLWVSLVWSFDFYLNLAHNTVNKNIWSYKSILKELENSGTRKHASSLVSQTFLIKPTCLWKVDTITFQLVSFLSLRFLLYVLVLLYVHKLFWFLVDRTVHFHYSITLPIIHTVLKKVYCTVKFITVLLYVLL